MPSDSDLSSIDLGQSQLKRKNKQGLAGTNIGQGARKNDMGKYLLAQTTEESMGEEQLTALMHRSPHMQQYIEDRGGSTDRASHSSGEEQQLSSTQQVEWTRKIQHEVPENPFKTKRQIVYQNDAGKGDDELYNNLRGKLMQMRQGSEESRSASKSPSDEKIRKSSLSRMANEV